MTLKPWIQILVPLCLLFLLGCYPGAPKSWIPGRYRFEKLGYETTMELKKDGTYTQTRHDPHGKVGTAQGTWTYHDNDHLYLSSVLPFYKQDGADSLK